MNPCEPLHVECPACGEVIAVPLVMQDERIEDEHYTFDVAPDLSDVWAHAWTHDEAHQP
jgi:hypothetical protein